MNDEFQKGRNSMGYELIGYLRFHGDDEAAEHAEKYMENHR